MTKTRLFAALATTAVVTVSVRVIRFLVKKSRIVKKLLSPATNPDCKNADVGAPDGYCYCGCPGIVERPLRQKIRNLNFVAGRELALSFKADLGKEYSAYRANV